MLMTLVVMWLLLVGTPVAAAQQEDSDRRRAVSPRVLIRERFPSGLKIDRFSTSWPSSAAVMADMLEGATARELLEQQQQRMPRAEHAKRVQQANRLIQSGQTSLGKSVQKAPKFTKTDDDRKGWTSGLVYV